jgi:hypothetical protein
MLKQRKNVRPMKPQPLQLLKLKENGKPMKLPQLPQLPLQLELKIPIPMNYPLTK